MHPHKTVFKILINDKNDDMDSFVTVGTATTLREGLHHLKEAFRNDYQVRFTEHMMTEDSWLLVSAGSSPVTDGPVFGSVQLAWMEPDELVPVQEQDAALTAALVSLQEQVELETGKPVVVDYVVDGNGTRRAVIKLGGDR